MKKFYFLILGIFIVFNLFPYNNSANAQGLLPCGCQEYDPADGSCLTGTPCTFCHFFLLLENIFDFVLKIAVLVAVLMFIIGGFYFFFASGEPGKIETARTILTSTTIGLVIILGAWLIVNTLLTISGFARADFGFNNWSDPFTIFTISCP